MRFTDILRAPRSLGAVACIALGVMQTSSRPFSPAWSPFVYTSLAGDTVAADSARVVVPERHDNPSGAKISLAVIRIRSTAARPGAPIVYLAGGPGNAGTSSARGEIFATIMELRSLADVIVYDQRGTGRTEP